MIRELINRGEIIKACKEVEVYSCEVQERIEHLYGHVCADRILNLLMITPFMYRLPTTITMFNDIHGELIYPRVAAKFVFERVLCIDADLDWVFKMSFEKLLRRSMDRVNNLPEINHLQKMYEDSLREAFLVWAKDKKFPFNLNSSDFSTQDDKLDGLMHIFSRGDFPGVSYEFYNGELGEEKPYITINAIGFDAIGAFTPILEDKYF